MDQLEELVMLDDICGQDVHSSDCENMYQSDADHDNSIEYGKLTYRTLMPSKVYPYTKHISISFSAGSLVTMLL